MIIQRGSCATHAIDLKQTFAFMLLFRFLCVADQLLHNEFWYNPAVIDIDGCVRGPVTIM